MTTKLKGSQIKVEDIVTNPSTLAQMTSTTKSPSESSVKSILGNSTVMIVHLSGCRYGGEYTVSDHNYDEIKSHIDNGGLVYVRTAEGYFYHLKGIGFGAGSEIVYYVSFYCIEILAYAIQYKSLYIKKYTDHETWKLTEYEYGTDNS